MKFMLKFNINDTGLTKDIHDVNLKQYVTKFNKSIVQNTMYLAEIEIDNINQIRDLGYYFDRDIKICGLSMDVLKVCEDSSIYG